VRDVAVFLYVKKLVTAASYTCGVITFVGALRFFPTGAMGFIGVDAGALDLDLDLDALLALFESSNSPGRIAWKTKESCSILPPCPLFERFECRVGAFSVEYMVLRTRHI